MERQLASIQKILSVEPIPDADKIEVASILGWTVVMKKNQFHENDLVIYCEIDSILPDTEWTKFLNGILRIRTRRFRKQLSQGIAFPLNILPNYEKELNGMESCNDGTGARLYLSEGTDVTELLGVKKWEPNIPAQLTGIIKDNFPSCVHKTDEIRVQSIPRIFEEITGIEVYISTKVDGCSMTCVVNPQGEFEVCSRNLSLKESEGNSYWKIARKLDIENILRTTGNRYSIQGELAGPGIQRNRLGLNELDLFVFNVYDIIDGKHLDFEEFKEFCRRNGLKTVPIDEVTIFNFTLEQLLEKAKGKYLSGNNREGIVIRPTIEMYSNVLKGRMSFKVINNDFLEKDEE